MILKVGSVLLSTTSKSFSWVWYVVNHTSDIYFRPGEYLGTITHWLITGFCTMIMSLLEKQKIVELQTLYTSLLL